MTPTLLLAWACAAALLFLSRSAYRLRAPEEVPNDAYAHLMLMKDIRENGFRYPDEPPDVATGGHYAYPHGMHWVLAFLPRRLWGGLDRYFSGIVDVLYSGFFLVLSATGVLSFEQFVLALGLFVATPEFARPDQAHGRGLSGRKPGALLVTGSLLAFLFWVASGTVAWLAASVLAAALVALTSKFGLQALAFVYLAVGALTAPVGLLVPVAGVVGAVLLSGGTYVRILRTHVRHSYNYAKQYGRWHPGSNIVASESRLRTVLGNLAAGDLSKGDLKYVRELTVVRIATNNPFVPLLVVTYAYGAWLGVGLPVPAGTHGWVAGGLFAFAFTSLPPFRFLGEAERYLEYTFLPAAVLVATAWVEFGAAYRAAVLLAVAFGLVVLVAYQYLYDDVVTTPAGERADWADLVSFISAQPAATVVVQPTNRARELAWETPHAVVEMGLNASSTPETVSEKNRLHEYGVPFVTDDVDWLDANYGPRWVVFDRTRRPYDGLAPPDGEPAFENDHFAVYPFERYR